MSALIVHKTYPPVGRCIYCDKTDVDLREEHIIPHGIGGRLVLPEASCLRCERITSKFDSRFQNNMIGDFRVRMGFLNRKGKLRRGRLPIKIPNAEGHMERVSIPAAEFPRLLILPQFPPPELIFGGPWDIEPQMFVATNKTDIRELAAKHPKGGFGKPIRYHIPTFCRVLAKIAHSYAVAEIPADEIATFDLLLPSLIREGSQKAPTNIVGGDMEIFPASEYLHDARIWCGVRDDREYLVARIRLFAPMSTPNYHVVVGTRAFSGKSLVERPVQLKWPLCKPDRSPD